MLALPALLHSGVLQVGREVYGSIGPAFYGLRTSMLMLLLMALARIKRAEDEGRTLVQSFLSAPADIEVTDDELRVCLHPLSSAHRTRVLVAVCSELDRLACRFPGSRLRLRYAVSGAPVS